MISSTGLGDKIGDYILSTGFSAVGNCRWAIVTKEGKSYFLKEFLRPKYPPPYLKDEVRKQKLDRCRKFERHHKRLLSNLTTICIPGGNIVAPVDFFRFGLIYYHVSPKVDAALIKPEEFSTLTEGTKAILIKTVINSIEILHRSHIVHCDLKPDNVLIHKTATENLVSKVIDLDGAFFEDDVPDPDDMQFDQQYMAPEILLYNQKDVSKKVNLSTAADVFSLGLIFFEFWTGIRVQYDRGRFGDPASTLIEGGKLSWDRSRVPTVLGDTIEAMLNLEPAVRPSIIQVGKRLSTLGLSKPAMGVEGSDRTLASSPSPSTAKVSIRFSKNLVR